MAAIHGKNYGKPTLDLNFAGNKSLIDTITRANYITFTRAQSGNEATYVGSDGLIKYAAADEARFDHDPATLESLGLLVEESRTNIFDQSEDIETWTTGLWTKTNNVAISPDGTQTAGSLVPNVGTTSQSSGRTVTQSAGNHVCSVFAKPNGLTVLKIRFSGSSYQAFFNLTGNGSVTSQNNGTASISKRPDGWYKCIFTINDTVGETKEWQIGHSDSSNVDGTNGFYIWGMQVEAGSFPTSYIPTSGSTVTREADVASITGTNFSRWYNQSEGTTIVSQVNGNTGGSSSVWSFDDGTANNRWMFRYGVGLITTNFATVSDNVRPYTATHATAVADNSLSYAKDGQLFASGSTGQFLTGKTTLNFGRGPAVGQCTTRISRLTYYPKRLPDIELQQLTK